ncbi:methylated-DNA--[protein]-cysteine S-methyltransferase [Vibrio sp. SM6]|uniref:Methylated-DNA--protein-cysteine methyltransferase n=1 Tax=Vibrio agarilyticus TaxID=2726741 RepID=A0A7X8YG16_9VIBR|nr:methylated-DNA--[protein]-cysteine S-methyltransferase [Vibrio agarilyticus]NLS11902.1 methylated-DNA--[protein]-cysteine S-methyltransferase [Vibrio agarilyticus]
MKHRTGLNGPRYYRHVATPLGEMTLQTSEQGLTGAWFPLWTRIPANAGQWQPEHPLLVAAATQLTQYFSQQRQQFDLPLDIQGTAFQQEVWQALTTIPYGETWSYLQLAQAIDNEKAVRAVGMANGKNPLAVIVPCHRVIGKNGQLTGYAGGLERKQKLLLLEGVKY